MGSAPKKDRCEAQEMKRSKLRPRSKKTQKLYQQKNGRREFVSFMLRRFRICQANLDVCTGASSDVHEIVPRSAGGKIVPEFDFTQPRPKADLDAMLATQWLSLCRACHHFITFNPKFAKEKGYKRR